MVRLESLGVGSASQRAEGRADRNEQRLNVNTVIQVLALLVTAGILYAAFHH